jgi:hypothetical protein
MSLYSPGSHAVHSAAPSLLKEPDAHGWHVSELESRYEPAGHGSQEAASPSEYLRERSERRAEWSGGEWSEYRGAQQQSARDRVW